VEGGWDGIGWDRWIGHGMDHNRWVVSVSSGSVGWISGMEFLKRQ